MVGGVVARATRRLLPLHGGGALACRFQLAPGPHPLLGPRPQLARALTRAPALVAQGIARRLSRHHRGWRARELIQALTEILPVFHDRLQLAVEHAEHRGVLVAERAAAGGALTL